jgi:hypothetical protein
LLGPTGVGGHIMAICVEPKDRIPESLRLHRRGAARLRRLNRSRAESESLPGAPSGGAPARLIFDAIERRILLNADVLTVQLAATPNDTQSHDLLVKMVDQAVQVGSQTQMVERVQVLDADHGNAVLAFGDLATISKVSIQGGAGANNITVDADSFGAHALPAIAIAGGPDAAQNTLSILHSQSSAPLDWQINGDGAGTVTSEASSNPLHVSFTGVGNLVGGAGEDILHGPAPNTSWAVTGAGSGAVTETNTGGGAIATKFAGFERLVGAPNNQDSFIFSPGASMADGVDGGAGGYDTITLAGGAAQSVVITATNASSGVLAVNGNSVAYTGMEPATISTAADTVTINLAGSDGEITLQDAAQPGMQLNFGSNTAEFRWRQHGFQSQTSIGLEPKTQEMQAFKKGRAGRASPVGQERRTWSRRRFPTKAPDSMREAATPCRNSPLTRSRAALSTRRAPANVSPGPTPVRQAVERPPLANAGQLSDWRPRFGAPCFYEINRYL